MNRRWDICPPPATSPTLTGTSLGACPCLGGAPRSVAGCRDARMQGCAERGMLRREGGREGRREGRGWRRRVRLPLPQPRPPPGRRCRSASGSGVPVLAGAEGGGRMASSRRLLLSTMKQICLCAAASFAVRPGSSPGSPARFPSGRVLRAEPCPPRPTCTPHPHPRVFPILLCPCLARGWGERAPPSQFAQYAQFAQGDWFIPRLWSHWVGGARGGTQRARAGLGQVPAAPER